MASIVKSLGLTNMPDPNGTGYGEDDMKMCLISIGVNDDGANPVLRFAEHDAHEVYEALIGAEGPVAESDAVRLLGDRATLANVFDAFDLVKGLSPSHLVFYFAGHGHKDGIELAGKTHLSFLDLIAELKRFKGSDIFVILDSCQAGGFYHYTERGQLRIGGVLDSGYMMALANATPSTRLMFSVGATRKAGENDQLNHGIFTAALLAAFRHASARLDRDDAVYLDDQAVFRYIKRHIREFQGSLQAPESFGLTGDFPMLRRERDNSAIGDGLIVGVQADPGQYRLIYLLWLKDRRAVATTFSYEVFSPRGKLLHRESVQIKPDSNGDWYPLSVRFNPTWIRHDLRTLRAFHLNREALLPFALTLCAAILDSNGEVMDDHSVRWFVTDSMMG